MTVSGVAFDLRFEQIGGYHPLDCYTFTLNGRFLITVFGRLLGVSQAEMGAWGALMMSFFGAVFASLTLYWHLNFSGIALVVPFLVFLLISLAAMYVISLPGDGIKPTPKEERAIMWSSLGEGIGLPRL